VFEYLPDGTMFSQHPLNGLGNVYRNYNLLGNITRVEGGIPYTLFHTYSYDGRKRLIMKDNKRYIYYNQLNPAAEVDKDGINKAVFVYATRINTPDYLIANNGKKYYFATDHLGSVRMVIDVGTGEVVHTVEYDEWGVITAETGNSSLHPFRFAGGFDMDGYYKFGFRYYDPANGRWTRKDPILFAGGDVNLYGYVMNDPVNWVDISGLWKISLNSGGHIFAIPGFASYGFNASSSIDFNISSLGSYVSMEGDGITGEGILGSMGDLGVSVGISDISDTNGKCAGMTLNFGLGRYLGVQITLNKDFNWFDPSSWIDGFSVGLGLGVPMLVPIPFSFTVPSNYGE
jgi:RHS repeat-associated protein